MTPSAQFPVSPDTEHQGDPGFDALVQGSLWGTIAGGLVGEMGRSHLTSAQHEFASASRASVGHIGAGLSRQNKPACWGFTGRHLVISALQFCPLAVLFKKWVIVDG